MSIDATVLRFFQDLLLSPGKRQISLVARRCAQEYQVGTRVGQRFVYDEKDLADVRALLEAHGLPLVRVEAQDRADASTRPGITEKYATASPHENSVAIRVFKQGASFGIGYTVASVDEVSEMAADAMMVVENFESFRQLHRYAWVVRRLQSIDCCLVVFRGDTIYPTGDAGRCINGSSLPKIGFHDFDPAGLHLSASLSGLVEHLLPPLPLLESAVAKGKRADLYFSQLAQYSSVLDQATVANIPETWKLMKKLQKGLPQEWMRDLAGE